MIPWTIDEGSRISLGGSHFSVNKIQKVPSGVVLFLTEIKPKKKAGVLKKLWPKSEWKHL